MARRALLLVAVLLFLGALLAGCCARKKHHPPQGMVELTAADGQKVLVLYGSSTQKQVLVYLHGRCEDVEDSLGDFAPSVVGQGHVVAPVGPEGGCLGGQRQWGGDPGRIDGQIRAAVAAAEARVRGKWDHEDQVLIGYSQGAARGEALLPSQPRFRRVIFLGAPSAPSARAYGSVVAAAFLAGEKDRRDLMMTGEQALRRAGKPVKFFLLPGADHGEFGPQGGPVMASALAFVLNPTR
jgi:dienelactone hydrolase